MNRIEIQILSGKTILGPQHNDEFANTYGII